MISNYKQNGVNVPWAIRVKVERNIFACKRSEKALCHKGLMGFLKHTAEWISRWSSLTRHLFLFIRMLFIFLLGIFRCLPFSFRNINMK